MPNGTRRIVGRSSLSVLVGGLISVFGLVAGGCSSSPTPNATAADAATGGTCDGHCTNGVTDCGETAADCGGECGACPGPAGDACSGHCGDNTLDCGETGVDCGGECGACPAAIPPLRGVNLAGADFGENVLPGTCGVNYDYPTTDEIDHFVGLGMNVFRVPFRWERLQRSQYAAFDATELGRLDAVVGHATAKGAFVLIDPHNYARYFGTVIGTSGVDVQAFADFWSKLATHFKNDDHVIFGLMNEPNTMSTDLWLADANAAIAAIRATGATNLILVPGNAWTAAYAWDASWYGTPNATAMLGVDDPLDNFAIEVHSYFDPDASGGSMNNCVSSTIGSERLSGFTDWLAAHNLRGFLGEFGAGTSATCMAAIDDMLTYMDQHRAQWVGWTYWAAGPSWGGAIQSIEPSNGADKPQTAVLEKHFP